MIIETLKSAILSNIGPLKDAPKGWHKTNCMLCHLQGHGRDTRRRFGIQFNPQSIAMNCFNCGFSAGYTEGKGLSKAFKTFLQQIHINDKFIEQIEFDIFKAHNGLHITRDGDETRQRKNADPFEKWRPMALPEDALPITEWLEYGLDDKNFLNVVDYALQRKLFDLEKFYWSPSKEFNVYQRLIIPYLYNGVNVGFTARLHYEVPDKSIPKYYQRSPTDFVYNLDNQRGWSRKYVLVTEGVLDAYVIDGVSILGEIGQQKIDIINKLQKQVIVCPDRDNKGSDLVLAAIQNNWAVAFPKWAPGIKDAAKAAEIYGRLLTTHSIISSAVSGGDKITLKWQIEQAERNKRTHYD